VKKLVTTNKPTSFNIAEERRPLLHRGGKMKSLQVNFGCPATRESSPVYETKRQRGTWIKQHI